MERGGERGAALVGDLGGGVCVGGKFREIGAWGQQRGKALVGDLAAAEEEHLELLGSQPRAGGRAVSLASPIWLSPR